MTNGPSRTLCAIYFLAIAAMWLMLSTSDYADARQAECSARSNRKLNVTWDEKSDTCKKETRNGTTSQNR